MDIYSIGEMVIDFIPGEEKGSYIRNAGGAPANVAIAAARNGLETGMCCKVGEDDFGKFLMETLKKEGVRVMCRKRCEEATTTMAFVSLKDDGERTFTFARKPGADMFLKEFEVQEEDIAASRVVHAGSCSLSAEPVASATRKALRLGHEMGKLVSFDINYRNLMWKDDKASCAKAVDEILGFVDILKISEEEVDMVGGEDNIETLMKEKNLTAVILTLGFQRCTGILRKQHLHSRRKNRKSCGCHRSRRCILGRFPLKPSSPGSDKTGRDHRTDPPESNGIRKYFRSIMCTEKRSNLISSHKRGNRRNHKE